MRPDMARRKETPRKLVTLLVSRETRDVLARLKGARGAGVTYDDMIRELIGERA